MNTRARQLLMILAGVVVGGAATSALKAQSTPVAYYIAQIDVTGNADTLAKEYATKVPATLEPFGGRFAVRGGKVVALEGDAPKQRIAIIVFDSVEKAHGWYNSAAYQEILPVRKGNAKTSNFIVEGLPK